MVCSCPGLRVAFLSLVFTIPIRPLFVASRFCSKLHGNECENQGNVFVCCEQKCASPAAVGAWTHHIFACARGARPSDILLRVWQFALVSWQNIASFCFFLHHEETIQGVNRMVRGTQKMPPSQCHAGAPTASSPALAHTNLKTARTFSSRFLFCL